ncbi:MAG: endonuclease MutS2 [Armatimonadetes bacterium]|nr:endonuclease MutS2 [Armatimonadota bacterium]
MNETERFVATDDRTMRVLEYVQIRDRLRNLAISPLGEEIARDLAPSADFAVVQEALQETDEARLLMREGELPLRGLRDVRAAIRRTRLAGTLRPEELVDVLLMLRATRLTKAYVLSRAGRAPQLGALALRVPDFSDEEEAIEGAIGEDATVLDSASPELARIRRDIHQTQERVRAQLEHITRSPQYAKMLQDPIVTVRGDRYVVPVKQQYVSQFPGILHDQSGSGATAFMEPLVSLQLGNRLRELQTAEAREIDRILMALSGRLGARADDLDAAQSTMARFDFAAAKGRLGDEMAAVRPALRNEASLVLHAARHPLLVARQAKDGRDVVANDAALGEAYSTLVITGPNTGGKTVTLKTVGLLSLMAQAGLHVPAADGSRCGIFTAVFADIGDEQSIEQSLSTFSSHMTAIVRILARAGEGTLVLLDEAGAGTDPAEGSALARAIIETLHASGARTIVTTHYSELKALAYQTPGIENASVEFDGQTLRPTYRLMIGTPGRSNALFIAERLGLSRAVSQRARSYLDRDLVEIDKVLAGIEADQKVAEVRRSEAERLRHEAEAERRQQEARVREAEAERDRAIAEARANARAIIERARAEVDELLRVMRDERNEKTAQEVRRKLAEMGHAAAPPRKPASAGSASAPLTEGARVRVVSLDAEGTVVRAERNHVEVRVGKMSVRVPRADVVVLDETAAAVIAREAPVPSRPALPSSLHLRGMTVDDAVYELEKYLDDATLARLPRAVIVHGKGTGALRKAVHDLLASYGGLRYHLAAPSEGGDGATVVEFS